MVMVSQPAPDLGDDILLCEGDSVEISFSGEYAFHEWHDQSVDATFIAKLTGPVSVTVTDEWNCQATDTVMVTVFANPAAIDLGPDTILCEDQSLVLDVGHYESYEWSTGENANRITVYAGAGKVSVTVTDINGCQAFDEINIGECAPVNLLVIPNTFTPNKDGSHDEWVIQNIHMFPDADIQVFDRWGRLIFHGKAGDNWDGTGPNGKDLPVENYYYIIDLKVRASDVLSGTISIVR
jgi:gliding motility-associated-like protein